MNKFTFNSCKILVIVTMIIFSLALSAGNPLKTSGSLSGMLHHIGQPGSLSSEGVLLYGQFNTSSDEVASQDFETNFSGYDCQGADDFVVPAGSKWRVDEIRISGSYYEPLPSPTVNVNVFFYEDNGGVPGDLIKEELDFPINTANFLSSGAIPLPDPVFLFEGRKWVSVQLRYDFLTNGQFYWMGSSVQVGNDAMWRNPLGGFGLGSGWMSTQILDSDIVDLRFAIYGLDFNAVPFPVIGSLIAFLGIGVASIFGMRRKRK